MPIGGTNCCKFVTISLHITWLPFHWLSTKGSNAGKSSQHDIVARSAHEDFMSMQYKQLLVDIK